MPESADVGCTLAFHTGQILTIRQYRALKAAADLQKLNVDDLGSKIFFKAMFDSVKAHASDATPPTQGQVEHEMQEAFMAKIQALAKP